MRLGSVTEEPIDYCTVLAAGTKEFGRFTRKADIPGLRDEKSIIVDNGHWIGLDCPNSYIDHASQYRLMENIHHKVNVEHVRDVQKGCTLQRRLLDAWLPHGEFGNET